MARKLTPDEALAFDEASARARLAAVDAISFLRHLADREADSAESARERDLSAKGSLPEPVDS